LFRNDLLIFTDKDEWKPFPSESCHNYVVHALVYSVILNILVSFLKVFYISVALGCKNRSQCISFQVHVLLYETPKIEFIKKSSVLHRYTK